MGRRKLVVFCLSLVLLIVATFLTLHQHTPPQFTDRPSFRALRWWTLPLEQNTALRPPVTYAGLYSVTFISPQAGWAVGYGGTILHTTDGGATWNTQTSPSKDLLRSVTFISPQAGWAVGTSGTILHTTDGGATWNTQTSPSQDLLYSVTFISPQAGWAVGTSGTILHTTDGGATWNTQTSPSKDHLYSVNHAGQCPGIALGNFYPKAQSSYIIALIRRDGERVEEQTLLLTLDKKNRTETSVIIPPAAVNAVAVVWKVPRGHWRGIDGTIASISQDSFVSEQIISSATQYYYDGKHLKSFLLSR